MLENLSAEIRDCYERAEECARKARNAQDERLRQDLLNLEEKWLRLARGFEFASRLRDFTEQNEKEESRVGGAYD